MKKPQNVMESMLGVTCEVLKKIAEILPKHDMLIQRLEPKIDSLEQRLNEKQIAFEQQLQQSVEQGFKRWEERTGSWILDRENLLIALCRVHSENTALVSELIDKQSDPFIVEKAQGLVVSLGKTLENYGVEVVTKLKGLPMDSVLMKVHHSEFKKTLPVGVVIKEISPGYRLRHDQGNRILLQAQVIVNEEKVK